jgi:tetratricopeptide (TPR) repeat protein
MKKKESRKTKLKEKEAGIHNLAESQKDQAAAEKELKKGNRAKALDLLMKAIDKCQENPEPHARLAEILIEQKDYARAQQHLENAIHFAKRAKYYYIKGKAFYHSGQWEEAFTEFKRAITETEGEREPIFYFMMAEMQYQLKDYKGAINSYKEAEKMIISYDQGKIKLSDFSLDSRLLAEVRITFFICK